MPQIIITRRLLKRDSRLLPSPNHRVGSEWGTTHKKCLPTDSSLIRFYCRARVRVTWASLSSLLEWEKMFPTFRTRVKSGRRWTWSFGYFLLCSSSIWCCSSIPIINVGWNGGGWIGGRQRDHHDGSDDDVVRWGITVIVHRREKSQRRDHDDCQV